MKSLDPNYLADLPNPNRLLLTVGELQEFKGKQELWQRTTPEVLAHLLNVAMIESVESSSRMERIEVGPRTRDRLLLKDEPPASENRDELEFAGYRDALDLIHKNAADMTLTESVVKQLHHSLMRYTPSGGGEYKIAANDIVEKDAAGNITRVRFKTVEPLLVEPYMQTLHERFAEELRAGNVHPLVLVTLYVHDFLCIHPFKDGNGRVARLVTVLMLHKLGYDVGRYVSIERIIEESKAGYYASLSASDAGWYESKHTHLPFTEYLLATVLSAYRELVKSTALDFSHGAKKRMVRRIVESMPAEFRLADVERKCSLLKRDSIRNAMTALRVEGIIESFGRGAGARWRRLA